jgi:hypothetical protein
MISEKLIFIHPVAAPALVWTRVVSGQDFWGVAE